MGNCCRNDFIYHNQSNRNLDDSLDVCLSKRVKYFYSLDDFRYSLIDSIIIDMMYEAVNRDKLYCKNDIYCSVKNRVFHKLEAYHCREELFKELFDVLWVSKYDSRGREKKGKHFFKYALNRQPKALWFFNSRLFVILFIIAFFYSAYLISSHVWDNQESIGLEVNRIGDFVAFIVVGYVVLLALGCGYKGAPFIPIILAILADIVLFVELDDFPSYADYAKTIWQMKYNIYLAALFLSWFPVIIINDERWNSYLDMKSKGC